VEINEWLQFPVNEGVPLRARRLVQANADAAAGARIAVDIDRAAVGEDDAHGQRQPALGLLAGCNPVGATRCASRVGFP